MRSRRNTSPDNFYEIFSGMALLMLAAFVFPFAVILISARLQGSNSDDTGNLSGGIKQQLEQMRMENKKLEEENLEGVVHLQQQLQQVEQEKAKLKEEMSRVFQDQSERILETAGLSKGKGKKDFDMFVAGLKNIPGKELHLIVDATGSMHGVTSFLIPVLRVIATRSGKHLSALSWYADRKTGTFEGTMGDMFDHLMQDAPFVGADETIGHAFAELAQSSPVPGAYLLIGDEPPSDEIHYKGIPAPVFTLPLGVDNDGSLRFAYKRIADETGGRTLVLRFR